MSPSGIKRPVLGKDFSLYNFVAVGMHSHNEQSRTCLALVTCALSTLKESIVLRDVITGELLLGRLFLPLLSAVTPTSLVSWSM